MRKNNQQPKDTGKLTNFHYATDKDKRTLDGQSTENKENKR
ncbi:hypothetical protein [Bacillus sp. LL01]|nr:hypothetical protein [Bacillus sp. LL01]